MPLLNHVIQQKPLITVTLSHKKLMLPVFSSPQQFSMSVEVFCKCNKLFFDICHEKVLSIRKSLFAHTVFPFYCTTLHVSCHFVVIAFDICRRIEEADNLPLPCLSRDGINQMMHLDVFIYSLINQQVFPQKYDLIIMIMLMEKETVNNKS